MKKPFGVKNYIIIWRRRIKKIVVIAPFFMKLSGNFMSKVNYFRRYINPYINVLEAKYRCSNTNKNEIKKKMRLAIMRMSLEQNELYLSRLVIVLGTKCSLRCRDCNNLMPYFKNPCELDPQKIKESVERICRISKQIFICELIGGEPFIANNLLEILEYLISIDAIKNIEITTNGTVIPKNQKVIDILRNPKVYVRISNYGDVVDNNKFISFLIGNKIRYELLQMETWISPGNIKNRNKRKEVLRKEYARCSSGYLCKTIFEDKLFACARAASLYALGVLPDEYINIDDNLTSVKLKNFILRDFSIACNYCDVANDNLKEVEPAIQLCR